MSKTILFNIAEGDLESQGFPVFLRISDGTQLLCDITQKIPPSPALLQAYRKWQGSYYDLGNIQRLFCRVIKPVEGQIIHESDYSSQQDCRQLAGRLSQELQHWFAQPAFNHLLQEVFDRTSSHEPMRVIFKTQDDTLQRLPWHLWQLFDRREQAEAIISLPSDKLKPSSPLSKPKILAILGCPTDDPNLDPREINLRQDKALINSLKQNGAEVTWLDQPKRSDLVPVLLNQSWDVLFFAGHSSSQVEADRGEIRLNAQETLSLNELRSHFTKAVQKGLKLAIFNSCDGLGMARDLARAGIPHTIVMREPVPDRVAQEFLAQLLRQLPTGKPLYLAILEARQFLAGMENDYPCASWLPVLCQNPGASELVWLPKSPWKAIGKVAVGMAGASLLLLAGWQIFGGHLLAGNHQELIAPVQDSITPEDFSRGDRILLDDSPRFQDSRCKAAFAEREKGLKAFAQGNYEVATEHLVRAMNGLMATRQPANDADLGKNTSCAIEPETLIALNNAVAEQSKNFLTIAASVPISSAQQTGTGSEMLLPIAQVQSEFNGISIKNQTIKLPEQGTYPKRPLLRIIWARDKDDKEDAAQVARNFIADRIPGLESKLNILGVIGPRSSGAVSSASLVYGDQRFGDSRLAAISPTSSVVRQLPSGGVGLPFTDYTLRTASTDLVEAYNLAQYAKGKYNNPLLVHSSQNRHAQGVKAVSEQALKDAGFGQVKSCDLNNDLQINCLEIAEQEKSDVLMFAIDPQAIGLAKSVISNNQQKLPILGNGPLYNPDSLALPVNGMVLSVPWHRDCASSSLLTEIRDFWGTSQVSWRFGLTYDAMQTMVQGLKEIEANPTRLALFQALKNPSFEADGATGKVRFTKSDRSMTEGLNLGVLVKVEPTQNNSNPQLTFNLLPQFCRSVK